MDFYLRIDAHGARDNRRVTGGLWGRRGRSLYSSKVVAHYGRCLLSSTQGVFTVSGNERILPELFKCLIIKQTL
jgi:hypothetical protein